MRGRIDHRSPRSQVHLSATNPFNHFFHIPDLNSAAGKNLNPITRTVNQVLDKLHSLGHAIFLPAGQNARDSQVAHWFQSLEWIGSHIEGAMKDRLALPDQLAKPPASWHINPSVGLQDAKH